MPLFSLLSTIQLLQIKTNVLFVFFFDMMHIKKVINALSYSLNVSMSQLMCNSMKHHCLFSLMHLSLIIFLLLSTFTFKLCSNPCIPFYTFSEQSFKAYFTFLYHNWKSTRYLYTYTISFTHFIFRYKYLFSSFFLSFYLTIFCYIEFGYSASNFFFTFLIIIMCTCYTSFWDFWSY